MRLPVEEQQNVIKCRHCPKFFISKPYLQKHYARHHPTADFFKEFAEDHPDHLSMSLSQTQALEMQATVNQRLEQMAKQMADERNLKQQ